MQSKKKAGIFSIGILLLSLSLVAASIYLFLRSKEERIIPPRIGKPSEKEADNHDANSWEIMQDEDYGYSLKYPSLLEPRTIESDNYLSFIIFFVPKGVRGSGFVLSVRENSIEEEVVLIKEEIQKDLAARLVNEEQIEVGGRLGARVEFEPAVEEGGEKRTIVIMNNGKYSYTLSSTPDQIDVLLSNFKIL
jgi:hypothetical protein